MNRIDVTRPRASSTLPIRRGALPLALMQAIAMVAVPAHAANPPTPNTPSMSQSNQGATAPDQSSTTGGTPGDLSVTLGQNIIVGGSGATPAVSLSSTGGTGGTGQDDNASYGGAGGTSGQVTLTMDEGSGVSSSNSGNAAIVLSAAGGQGGTAGDQGDTDMPGQPGHGGDSAGVTFNQSASVWSTDAWDGSTPGTTAVLMTANGGNSAQPLGTALAQGYDVTAPSGGAGGNGGTIGYHLYEGDVTSGGSAIVALSRGGLGGDGTDAYAGDSKGGTGGGGGDGGAITITTGQSGMAAPNIKAVGASSAATGATVPIDENGNTAQAAMMAAGIQAQSIGGLAGNGGFSDGGDTHSGAGGAAGDGSTVQVTLGSTNVSTTGFAAAGVLAQSIGGAGGNGAASSGIWSHGGGHGGAGGNADEVDVSMKEWTASQPTSLLKTAGNDSIGVVAQSIGGGGGAGGAMQTGSIIAGVGIGGDGESGGTGGVVTLRNGAPDDGASSPAQTGFVVSTKGERSSALVAQSIGGGGGTGGSASNSSVGVFNYAVGGSGGSGGSAGKAGTNQVTVYNGGIVSTQGNHAKGVVAQAVGGGGGDGGSAVALNAGSIVNVNVAVGGSGGNGGTAGDVAATNAGQILTSGSDAWGLEAQSVGDGGGNGGMSKADAYTLAVSQEVPNVTINVGVGGKGGDGASGGNVGATNSGLIMTSGASAHGILAQSISGGGGAGGDSSTQAVTGGSVGNSLIVDVSVGGNGGGSSAAGNVTADNAVGGFIFTAGDSARGVFAQSVGGGGGHGGAGKGDSRFVGQKADSNASLTLSVGGSGGGGAAGGNVTASSEGNILTIGDNANALFAQSVGGGGGVAGAATAKGSGSKQAEVVTVTGAAGSGANGGTVTATNTGNIVTVGGDAAAIYAQSIGAGGGKAGSVTTAGLPSTTAELDDWLANSTTLKNDLQSYTGVQALKSGTWGGLDNDALQGIAGDYQAYAASLKNDPADATSGSSTMTVSAGGGTNASNKNASIGDGGPVTVNNSGFVLTEGAMSAGVFAQSVGGGGGDAGATQVRTFKATGPLPASGTVVLGGRLANEGSGGTVNVNSSGQPIVTKGDASFGVFSQSIGGGGGQAGLTADAYAPGTTLTLGADNDSQGDGNTVAVQHSNTFINTSGNDAVGIVAQSIGGGGGDIVVLHTKDNGSGYSAGSSDPTIDAQGSQVTLAVGGASTPATNAKLCSGIGDGYAFNSCGKGGDVSVTSTVASLNTQGRNAHGILAQSLGGGGGWATGLTFNQGHVFASQDEISITNYARMGGNAGNVTVSLNGDVVTSGDGAYGVLAQSVGGGGILAGDLANGGGVNAFPFESNYYLGPASVRWGNGGDVGVTINGYLVRTSGANAPAIFAQSVGGGGGLFATTTGLMMGTVQGTGTPGSVTVTNNNGIVQALGKGSSAIVVDSEGHYAASAVHVENSGAIYGNPTASVINLAGQFNTNGNGTVDNSGVIAPADSNGNPLSGTAVMVTDPNPKDTPYAVVNNQSGGKIYGNLLLGSKNGAFVNDGYWGTDVNSTAQTFTNNADGTIQVNGYAPTSMAISTLNGDLNSAGTIATPIGFLNGNAPLTVNGMVNLSGGTLLLSPTTLVPIPTQPLNAFVAGGNVNIIDTGNYLFTYSGSGDGEGDFYVTPQSHLAANAQYMSSNLQQIAQNLDSNFTATATPSMAQTYANLSTINNQNDYFMALTNMLDEGVQAATVNRLGASQAFVERMNSCPQFEQQGALTKEHDCGWVRYINSDADHEATTDSVGYRNSGQNVQLGGQREVSPGWFLGGSVSYDTTDLNTRAVDGNLDGNGWSAGVVAKHESGDWLISGAIDGGRMSYDANRHLLFTGIDRQASSQFDVTHYGVHSRISLQVPHGPWYLKPYMDLHATHIESGEYTEQGAGELSLNVKGSSQNVFSVAPMLEAGGRVDFGNDKTLRLYGAVGGAFYSADAIGADMQLVEGDPAQGTFHIESDLPNERIKATAGVDLKASDRLNVRLEYGGEFASHYDSNTESVKVSYRF